MSAHECLVRFELPFEFFLSESSILHLRPLSLWLGDRSGRKPKFDFLPALVIGNIRRRDTLHPEDLNLVAITSWKRIVNTW
jgi:hypothetical protein